MTKQSTTTRTELAHRSGDGLDVTLLVGEGRRRRRAVVCVSDS